MKSRPRCSPGVRAPSKACPQEAPIAADPLCGVGSTWPFASCSGNASLKAGGITAAAFNHTLSGDGLLPSVALRAAFTGLLYV